MASYYSTGIGVGDGGLLASSTDPASSPRARVRWVLAGEWRVAPACWLDYSLYRAPDSQLGTALAQHCTLTVIRLPYAPHASTLLSDTVPWPY